jgi:hypothetical protein
LENGAGDQGEDAGTDRAYLEEIGGANGSRGWRGRTRAVGPLLAAIFFTDKDRLEQTDEDISYGLDGFHTFLSCLPGDILLQRIARFVITFAGGRAAIYK